MARTVIEDNRSEPVYATESGVSQGVIIGLLVAAVVVVIAILAATGVFSTKHTGTSNPGVVNNNTNTVPSTAPQGNVPSAPAAAS